MNILFKFATRSRPDKFFAGIDNILSHIDDRWHYQILVSADDNDFSMNNESFYDKKCMYELAGKMDNVLMCYGTSENKIHAINRDIEKAKPWDILINFSDDMVFQVQGFDNIIRSHFNEFFPDTDGCLHYPDGNTDLIITMSVLGRKYFDRLGYIYHPSYKSLWADNEQTDVARALGKYKFINQQLFEHQHPAWGKTSTDDQYKHTESFYHIDNQTYLHRKYELGFGLKQTA